jgi:uncharacterized protein YjbJ (UPF0337 family)
MQKAKGRAKEAIGKAVGNRGLEREGKRDQIVGDVKNKAARVKRGIEDKVDETIDELESRADRGSDRSNG